MKQEIKIPAMGESVTEATIASFLKPSGSAVEESEEIVELETEKVNQVLYAPISGTLYWTVNEKDTLPIGGVIGFVDSEKAAEKAPEEKKPPKKEAPKKEEVKESPPKKPAPKEPAPKKEKKGESLRMMKEEFVSELKKPPMGEAPKEQPPMEEPPTEEETLPTPEKKERTETRRKMSKLRQTIATRLVEALHTAAMLTTFNEADMSAIMEIRARYKESFEKKHGVKLGLMSFFVKAVVESLKAFPDLNSYIERDEIVHRDYFDIGIAVSTEKGLFVPVVRDADRLSFAEIEKKIGDFAKRAKEGKITIADLSGGGFTITNGGVFGSLLSAPILNPPQVGILGMHQIKKRAVVVDDQIVIRPMMYLALSYDHRIVDGKEAISFLVHVKEILEDPSKLLFFESDGTF